MHLGRVALAQVVALVLLAGCSSEPKSDCIDTYDASGLKTGCISDDEAIQDAERARDEISDPLAGSSTPTEAADGGSSSGQSGSGSGLRSTISPSQAARFYGEVKQVCGLVASVGGGGADPVFLNFGQPYPDQTFAIVLWNERETPKKLVHRIVCATGRIVAYRGTPQIQLDDLTEVHPR